MSMQAKPPGTIHLARTLTTGVFPHLARPAQVHHSRRIPAGDFVRPQKLAHAMQHYRDWPLMDSLPAGWSFSKAAGSPLTGYAFAMSGGPEAAAAAAVDKAIAFGEEDGYSIFAPKAVLALIPEDMRNSRPVGRPSEIEGGKRVNVYLDAESLDIADKLGNGNVSDGIRKALKKAAE